MFCFQGFTEFSGLRSSSASLPFGKKLSSDEFVSIVSFQTSAVSTLFSSNIVYSLRVVPYDDHQLYEMFAPISMSIDKFCDQTLIVCICFSRFFKLFGWLLCSCARWEAVVDTGKV